MRRSAVAFLALIPGFANASQGPGVASGAAGPGLQAAAAGLALGPLIIAGLLALSRLLRRAAPGKAPS